LLKKLAIAAIALAGTLGAQLAPPNEAGMRMGHVHFNVRDVEAQKKFWVSQVGAKAIRVGKAEGVEIPGLIVLFRKQEPTGTVAGGVIDHLGLKVRKLDELMARFKAAGSKVEEPRMGRENTLQTYVTGPDDFRMELVEDPSIAAPVVSHHLHYFLADPIPVKEWYVRHLMVKPGMRGPYEAGDVPGMNLSFAPLRAGPTVAIKGRVMDHVSFDVTNLREYCRRLEEDGIKFDSPYKKDSELGIWTVMFTDPWGTFIELTEGLQ
jgi:catechol 2,3-dioxygenase-like lactoylglutathione lyase family enzyme